MIHLALRHELACAPEVYWACVLDFPYNEALFLGALRFARYEILEQTECVTVVRRRVRAEPPPDSVPGFLRKALPYFEEGELDRARSLYTFRTINVTMPVRRRIDRDAPALATPTTTAAVDVIPSIEPRTPARSLLASSSGLMTVTPRGR